MYKASNRNNICNTYMQPAGNIAGIEYLVCMSASDVPHFRKRGMLRDCEAARSALKACIAVN